MLVGLVLVGMTTGTVRLVGGRSPGHCLRVRFMASPAVEISAVVARIAPGTMAKDNWRPAGIVMAAVTLQIRDEMIARLALGYAAVVTA